MSRYAASELLELYNLHKNIFYQSFDCPKTNFGSIVSYSFIHQMLMTRLLEVHQESHIEFRDLTGNPLILSIMPETT